MGEIAEATGRTIQGIQIPHEPFSVRVAEMGPPEDIAWLLDYLFATVVAGRHAHLADGERRALGRSRGTSPSSRAGQPPQARGTWRHDCERSVGMDQTIPVVGTMALLGSALVGGIFFAFSSFVMKALASVPSADGIGASKSINFIAVDLAHGPFVHTNHASASKRFRWMRCRNVKFMSCAPSMLAFTCKQSTRTRSRSRGPLTAHSEEQRQDGRGESSLEPSVQLLQSRDGGVLPSPSFGNGSSARG